MKIVTNKWHLQNAEFSESRGLCFNLISTLDPRGLKKNIELSKSPPPGMGMLKVDSATEAVTSNTLLTSWFGGSKSLFHFMLAALVRAVCF